MDGFMKTKVNMSEWLTQDFFVDPPEDALIKKRGIDAVKLIRAERK